MQRETVYEIWVPPQGVWSLWARPVLFAQMPEHPATGPSLPAPGEEGSLARWLAIDVSWAPDSRERALLVVDLPGGESVLMGLALAGRGYRPVPGYNACTGPNEVISQGPIMHSLREGADYLGSLPLAADSPPAFLLDARRLRLAWAVQRGMFDNRWQVFPQDFPSANFLRAQDITRVLLIQRGGRKPEEDLAHVLRRWQDAGLPLWAKDVAEPGPPVPIRVDAPPWYRQVWYRVLALLGLHRNPLGGFGGMIPRPGQG